MARCRYQDYLICSRKDRCDLHAGMIKEMVGKIAGRFGQGSSEHIQAQTIAEDAGHRFTRMRALVFLSDLMADGTLWSELYTGRLDPLWRRN